MGPRRFALTPGVAPDVTIYVEDSRETASADDDLIDFGFRATRHELDIAVALDLDEIVRLRDALNAIIETPLP
jgi:hypothetical protein